MADRIFIAILKENSSFNLAKLTRGLKLVADQSDLEMQQQAIQRLIAFIDRNASADDIMALSSALGDNVLMLTPEQARFATKKLLLAMDSKKNPRKFSLLARSLEGLAVWLDADEAQRACVRIMEGVADQDYPPVMGDRSVMVSQLGYKNGIV